MNHSNYCDTCFHTYQQDDPVNYVDRITCEICGNTAHRNCYAPNLNGNTFKCDPCLKQINPKKLKCIICQQKGLMKQVSQGQFGHILCLAFNTNYVIQSYENLSFLPSNCIIAKNKSPSSMRKCKICQVLSRLFNLVKCDMKNCRSYTHIYCFRKKEILQKNQWVSYIGHLNFYADRNFMERNFDFYRQYIKANYQKCYRIIWGKSPYATKQNITKPSTSDFFCQTHSSLMPLQCFCGEEKGDDCIECDSCLSWSHMSCQQMNNKKANKKYFTCRQCVEWKNIIKNKKRPLLDKYPILHFYDMVFIQRYYERRNYILSQKDQNLLNKIQLKPSLCFYEHFVKSDIWNSIKHKIDIRSIQNYLVKQQIKLQEEEFKLKPGKTKKSKQKKTPLKSQGFYQMKILLASNYQLSNIQQKINGNITPSPSQIAEILGEYQKFKSNETDLPSVLIQTSVYSDSDPFHNFKIVEDNVLQNIQNQLSIQSVQYQTLKSQQIIQQNSDLILFEKQIDEMVNLSNISRLFEIYNTARLSSGKLRKLQIQQFDYCFENCSKKQQKQTLHLWQQLKLGEPELIKKKLISQTDDNIKFKNSSDFYVWKLLVWTMNLSIKQEQFQLTKYASERIVEASNLYSHIMKQQDRNIRTIFLALINFKNKLQLSLFSKKYHREISQNICNISLNPLNFLKSIPINPETQIVFINFFFDINNIFLKKYPRMYEILYQKGCELLNNQIRIKKYIESQQQTVCFRYVIEQFNVQCSWLEQQLKNRQQIKTMLASFHLDQIINQEICQTWKRTFKNILFTYKNQVNYQSPLVEVLQNLKYLQCINTIFQQLPRWLLFPQENYFQQRLHFKKIEPKIIYQIQEKFDNMHFPDCLLKRKIEEIKQLMVEQTKVLHEFMTELQMNIVNENRIVILEKQRKVYKIGFLIAEMEKLKDSIFDFSHLEMEVQTILTNFYQIEIKLLKAAREVKSTTLTILIKQIGIFPIQCENLRVIMNKNKKVKSQQIYNSSTKFSIQGQLQNSVQRVIQRQINSENTEAQRESTQFRFDSEIFFDKIDKKNLLKSQIKTQQLRPVITTSIVITQ